jgi:DNA polymerase elongation subunit (family B)
MCSIIYGVHATFPNIFSSVRQLEAEMFKHLTERGLAWDPRQQTFSFDADEENEEKYPGGYVYQPEPRFYKWVASFDLNSLYPNLIVQYNMSPETIVPHMKVAALQNGGEDKI